MHVELNAFKNLRHIGRVTLFVALTMQDPAGNPEISIKSNFVRVFRPDQNSMPLPTKECAIVIPGVDKAFSLRTFAASCKRDATSFDVRCLVRRIFVAFYGSNA